MQRYGALRGGTPHKGVGAYLFFVEAFHGTSLQKTNSAVGGVAPSKIKQ